LQVIKHAPVREFSFDYFHAFDPELEVQSNNDVSCFVAAWVLYVHRTN